jgi:predicted enzyme related to lactoylglutathione lyase
MDTLITKPTVQIREIAFTGYPVTDLARARNFYENVLGLKTSAIWESSASSWIEYNVGAATLAITNMSPEHWKPSQDGPSLAFEVEDFESAIQALRDAAVVFYLDPFATEACQLAVIADPDGNSIAIHRRAQK